MHRLFAPSGAPLIDAVAACCAALAAAAAHWIAGRLLRPFHPSAVVAPREGRGLLSFLGQNGYDIFVNEGLAASYRALQASGFRAVCFRVFYFHRMLVGHPQDLEHIMVHNSANYVKGADYKFLKVTLGDGLVTLLDDATHSAHRRAINPAFAPAALKEIADTCMRLHALEMLKSVRSSMQQQQQQQQEAAAASGSQQQRPYRATVRSIVNRPALNIIADAAFHTGPEEVKRVGQHFQTILTAGQALGVLGILPIVREFPSPAKIQRAVAMRDLSNFLRQVSQTVRANAAAAASGTPAPSVVSTATPTSSDQPQQQQQAVFEGKAIVDYLVQAGIFSDRQMLDHSLTFMFAGHETSSNTIQWIILLLATHPAVQERLCDELATVMGLDACPEITALHSCRFLGLVVKEGMRLYPVAPIIMREAVEDDVLPFSKVVVPKGTSVNVHFFVSQRNPGIYGSDADTFRPDRWEDPSLAARVGVCGWMPFSVGKRNCIGKDFALNEISIIVAILVRNFQLVFPEGHPFPKRRVGITMSTKEPYEVDFTARIA